MRCVRTVVVDGPPENVWALLQAPETHVAMARPFLSLSPGDGHNRFAELLHDGPTSFRLKLFGVLPLGTRVWHVARPVNQPGRRFYALEISATSRGLLQRRVLALSLHPSGRTQIEERLQLSGWRAGVLAPFSRIAQRARLRRLARVVVG